MILKQLCVSVFCMVGLSFIITVREKCYVGKLCAFCFYMMWLSSIITV